MAIKNNELSGRAIIICIFVGFLTTVLVFLFVKRQFIRFTLKNRRGPHFPIGDEAPKHLKREIERRFELIQEIKYEPLLINSENQFDEFPQRTLGCDGVPTEHIYRMKAVDDLKYLEELLISIGNHDIRRSPRTDLRTYLLRLTAPGELLFNCDMKLLQQFVDLYMHARHDADPPFAATEYKEYVRLHRKLQKFLIRKHNLTSNSSNYLVRSLSESAPSVITKSKLPGHMLLNTRAVMLDTTESAQETCV